MNRSIATAAFIMYMVVTGCHNETAPITPPPPAIGSFDPTSGIVGTHVLIIGSNFSSSIPDNKVKFNGGDAEVIYADRTEIKVIVPAGFKTGKITVSVNNQSATSNADFFRNPEVSTVVGLGGTRSFKDGPADVAKLISPYQIALDISGNIVVADEFSYRVRKIDLSGSIPIVSTLTGSDTRAIVNGPVASAQLLEPMAITIGPAGDIYFTQRFTGLIRVLAQGMVNAYAGIPTIFGSLDGTTAIATFEQPTALTTDVAGNLFIVDAFSRIRKISTAGVVTTIAGGATGFLDGPVSVAKFTFSNTTGGITLDQSGNLYVSDTENHRIRKITPEGNVTTIAGSTQGHADGVGVSARFTYPGPLAIDGSGNLIVGDYNAVRKITPLGEVTTIAGGSIAGFVNGEASQAKFNFITGLVIDKTGNLYVSDNLNDRIRKISF